MWLCIISLVPHIQHWVPLIVQGMVLCVVHTNFDKYNIFPQTWWGNFACHGERLSLLSNYSIIQSLDGLVSSYICYTLFQSSWPNKCIGTIDDSLSITECWCWCQLHCLAEKSCCTLLQLSWTHNGAIDDAISNTWCWCWWHHMTKKFIHTLCGLSPPKKQNGAIGITWCWHQCRWHHMTSHCSISNSANIYRY